MTRTTCRIEIGGLARPRLFDTIRRLEDQGGALLKTFLLEND